jgi:hypothetical protein
MEGSYATHGTNASPLTPNLKNLIKNVIQECACPFAFFSFVFFFRPFFRFELAQTYITKM